MENEPERQIRRTIKAADKVFKTNSLWPPLKRHLEEGQEWLFGLKEMNELYQEIERLRKLL